MAKANYMLCDACGQKTVYIGADEHPLYPIFCDEECVIAFASRLSVAAPPVVVPVDAVPLYDPPCEADCRCEDCINAADGWEGWRKSVSIDWNRLGPTLAREVELLRSRLTAVEQERDEWKRIAKNWQHDYADLHTKIAAARSSSDQEGR